MLAVILGVVVSDIVVAHAQIADNNKKAALKKLHRAEAAYAVQVDGISKKLYFTIQPVQDALDKADASNTLILEAVRNTVVNARISPQVTKLSAQVQALTPPKTMVEDQKALVVAVKNMAKYLANLEKAKKSKDASDFLATPYSGHILSLGDALDSWYSSISKIDAVTHRPIAPTPGAAGSPRSKLKIPASKASWIFGADKACGVASHAMYLVKDPGQNASPAAYAKFLDRLVAIDRKTAFDLRKLPLPTADRARLQRGVYKALKASDQLQNSYKSLATALRHLDYNAYQRGLAQEHVAIKGMTTLSAQFNGYGAEFCGWFFDPKPDTKKKSGGGTVSA
ncbi:MAG: hypothetical protein QOG53_169 [Frankiales bacterium]|nr:hypothetical protein [Frankiales bacterium]